MPSGIDAAASRGLVELLTQIPLLSSRAGRDLLVVDLPPGLVRSLERSDVALIDLQNMVSTCASDAWTPADAATPPPFRQLVEAAMALVPGTRTALALQALLRLAGYTVPELHVSDNTPAPPTLLIGRGEDRSGMLSRLSTMPPPPVTVIRGWPGVGKTTFVAALAYDPAFQQAFPDGVLWAALGEQPGVLGQFAAWGRALGEPDLGNTMEEARERLRALLHNRRCLLIVDDAWQAADVQPFKVGGPGCALLLTTRLPEVARQVAPNPATDIYLLGVLSVPDGLALLQTLAPGVVAENEADSRALVEELEGLPLAIQVAGRLLHTEASYGFGVGDLLVDIRERAAVLQATAPPDRVEDGVTPTVQALLQRSTDKLNEYTRDCFAYLGAFAPKPATFDMAAMQAVWEVDDAKPIIRTLVDRGLLEPTGTERYWMHALLVDHARSFLTD